jgi:hypothetical protein
MGEIAEMMLDGTLCEGCGTFMGESVGYQQRCLSCRKDGRVDALRTTAHVHHRAQKMPCTTCGKRVKVAGLNDHMRDAHAALREEKAGRG